MHNTRNVGIQNENISHSVMLVMSYHTPLTVIHNTTWLVIYGGNFITYRCSSLC